MLPRRLSVFPDTGGFAAGSRIGPAPSPVTHTRHRGSRTASVLRPSIEDKSKYPQIARREPDLWITRAAILAFDGASPLRGEYDPVSVAVLLNDSSPPRFAHDSEAELARVLDFYQVAWRYEPDVFPLTWSPSGAVVESFAPDFYLPELGLYVELTTLRQALVRKKNRKLRLLRQLYPEVRIKLLYMRDFTALMVKYGRVDFLLDMSGTNGNGANGNGASGHSATVRRAQGSAASGTGR